ncbi:MAG: ATP synthase F0 subunit B [Acidobacteriota bacterium]
MRVGRQHISWSVLATLGLLLMLPLVAVASEEAEGEHAGNPILEMVAKVVNFGVLAGTLVYFLRSPMASYLTNRKVQIRRDLVRAREMKEAATAQLTQIDEKMAALPAELEALRKAGAEEVVAEESRIRGAAEHERMRLLENTKRDLQLQLRIAERTLTRHAAELAIAVATDRAKQTITDQDQRRLVERYLGQVGGSV